MKARQLIKILQKHSNMIIVHYDPIINGFVELEEGDIMEALLTKDGDSGLYQAANLHSDDEEQITCLNL